MHNDNSISNISDVFIGGSRDQFLRAPNSEFHKGVLMCLTFKGLMAYTSDTCLFLL